ncbi:MAG: AraC family transcriptional regulator [Tannerellaceae bacterium]
MLYLNQTYDLLIGGYYLGNSSWNKKHTEIDNCFKIYQLTEGEVFIYNKEQRFNLQKNKLYFINGNMIDYQHCSSSFSLCWLHFIPKDLIIYQGLLSLPTVVELPIEEINLQDIMPSLENLLTSNMISNWQFSLDILNTQTFLQRITLMVFAQHPTNDLFVSFEAQRIEPAIHYINQCYRETIKLEELANKCCMSPNYFHKIFKTTLNLTPANYQTLLRMNTALQLLADERQTIKSIAYELGFTDDAHFCRSFKKYYGIPPGEYKKQRGNILL